MKDRQITKSDIFLVHLINGWLLTWTTPHDNSLESYHACYGNNFCSSKPTLCDTREMYTRYWLYTSRKIWLIQCYVFSVGASSSAIRTTHQSQSRFIVAQHPMHKPARLYVKNFKWSTTSWKPVVSFLPILDLKPSDPTCIFSVLNFIINQAKVLGANTRILTFDQPLSL